ncbi:MAG: hypothetical protein GY950_14275, partial [bacterium]|nr:hypothetical protein [bacterium]
KDVRLTDLFRVLRDHYEDTEYDLTDNYKKGSPNFTKNRTICTKTTRYSFAAELREEVPPELAHRIWISFRRPDSNAYCPWYASIPAAPDGYTRGSSHAALYIHFKLPGQFFAFNPDYAYWHFDKLSQLVDKDYKPRIKTVRKEWQNFENYTLKRLKKTEKEFQYFLTANKKIALKIITNYIYKLEYRRWLRTTELIHQLEK